jgi:hypothetical protein
MNLPTINFTRISRIATAIFVGVPMTICLGIAIGTYVAFELIKSKLSPVSEIQDRTPVLEPENISPRP